MKHKLEAKDVRINGLTWRDIAECVGIIAMGGFLAALWVLAR